MSELRRGMKQLLEGGPDALRVLSPSEAILSLRAPPCAGSRGAQEVAPAFVELLGWVGEELTHEGITGEVSV